MIASQILSETKAWLWGNVRYIFYASERREREREREKKVELKYYKYLTVIFHQSITK